MLVVQREWFEPMTRGPSSRHKFPKKLRLAGRSDFLSLRKGGRKTSGRYFYMITNPGEGHARIGIAVSRRVGGAVERNRLKRRIREIFRHNPERFPQSGHVLVGCRPGAAELAYEEIEEELFRLLDKSRKA
jgi:ribonuclease P protein component